MKKAIVCLLAITLLFSVSAAFSESATATLQEMYSEAELKMATGDYSGAADIFDKMGTYSDCSQMAMYCKAFSAAEDLGMYEVAVDAFTKLGEFRDCPQLVTYYSGRMLEALVDSTIQNKDLLSDEDLENAKKMIPVAKSYYSELALFKDSLSRYNALDEKEKTIEQELIDRDVAYKTGCYEEGIKKREEKDWEGAVAAFTEAGDYSDASKQILITRYTEGTDKREGKDWDGAAAAFALAGDYSDAGEQILLTRYTEGTDKKESQDYASAAVAFAEAKDYQDAAEQALESWYLEGMKRRDNQEWEEAINAFINAGKHSDASTQVNETKYMQASALEANGDQEGAYALFVALGEYKDSYERAYKPYYDLGIAKKEAGEWDEAVAAFEHAGEYEDAKDQVSATRYAEGMAKREAQDWDGAVKVFMALGEYSDAAAQVSETRYMQASALETEGDQEGAYKIFIKLGEYKDSFERANKPYYDLGVAKRDLKEWDEAVAAFAHAGEYSDAASQIPVTYYTEGADKQENKDWLGAADAFRLAGDYQDAAEQVNVSLYRRAEQMEDEGNLDESYIAFMELGEYKDSITRARKRQYDAAETAIAEHRYVDALLSYRRAIGYEDAYQKAVRLEKKFFDMTNYNNINNTYWYSFITADGSAYNVNYGKLKSAEFTDDGIKAEFDWKSSIQASLWIDGKTTAGAIQTIANEGALLQDGSITGYVYETPIKVNWKSIKAFDGYIWYVFGIRSDGRLLAWATDTNKEYRIDQISKLKDIIVEQIINNSNSGDLIILDNKGQTYRYDWWNDEENVNRIFKLNLSDVREILFYQKIYALCNDGSMYRYSSDKWEKAEDLELTWEEMLLGGYLLSGKVDPFDNRIANRGYLTIYADGTITIRDMVVNNGLKLWNDQTELQRIFEWEAPAIDDLTHCKEAYNEAMELFETDPQGSYRELSAIVRYPDARAMINTDKQLVKIRNAEFGKGKEITFGRKDGRAPDTYTIVDQQKDRVLVLSNTVYEYTLAADLETAKWKETELYRSVLEKYDSLFSDAEKELILPVNNGEMKGEYVFCPNVQEMKKYCPKPENRKMSVNGEGVDWITRTVGKKGKITAYNTEGKQVDIQGVAGTQVYYRLMFWVDLNQLPLDMSKMSGN